MDNGGGRARRGGWCNTNGDISGFGGEKEDIVRANERGARFIIVSPRAWGCRELRMAAGGVKTRSAALNLVAPSSNHLAIRFHHANPIPMVMLPRPIGQSGPSEGQSTYGPISKAIT